MYCDLKMILSLPRTTEWVYFLSYYYYLEWNLEILSHSEDISQSQDGVPSISQHETWISWSESPGGLFDNAASWSLLSAISVKVTGR